MCYSDAVLMQAVDELVENGTVCLKCGDTIDPDDEYIFGIYFTETGDDIGPQHFDPETFVSPYVLCNGCCVRTEMGHTDYLKTKHLIDEEKLSAIFAGRSPLLPIGTLARSVMLKPGHN